MPDQTIGDIIRTEREAAGLTVYALAQKAGKMSAIGIHRIEDGTARDPNVSTIARLAEALGVVIELPGFRVRKKGKKKHESVNQTS